MSQNQLGFADWTGESKPSFSPSHSTDSWQCQLEWGVEIESLCISTPFGWFLIPSHNSLNTLVATIGMLKEQIE